MAAPMDDESRSYVRIADGPKIPLTPESVDLFHQAARLKLKAEMVDECDEVFYTYSADHPNGV